MINEPIKDFNLEIDSTNIYRALFCLLKANITVWKAIESNEYLKIFFYEISTKESNEVI